MSRYLPKWATIEEACAWLAAETGETWVLARLLESGVWPSVWTEYNPEYEALFEGHHEGFLAPFVFGGDITRLSIDRTSVMTMSRTPSGKLVRFTPGISGQLSDLRFSSDDVRRLAKLPASEGAPVKRRELVKRHKAQWERIEADLGEASRNGLSVARAEGGWIEVRALTWAKQNGRLSEPVALPSLVHRQRR